MKTTCLKAIVQKKKRTMKLEMFFNFLFLDIHSASRLNCKSSAVPSSSSYWFGVGENIDLGVKVKFIGIFSLKSQILRLDFSHQNKNKGNFKGKKYAPHETLVVMHLWLHDRQVSWKKCEFWFVMYGHKKLLSKKASFKRESGFLKCSYVQKNDYVKMAPCSVDLLSMHKRVRSAYF